MESNPIEVSIDGSVATVCINRPERKNALSVAAANGLTDAWKLVEADDTAAAHCSGLHSGSPFSALVAMKVFSRWIEEMPMIAIASFTFSTFG